MKTNHDSLEEKIDRVTPERIRQKPETLARLRVRFDNLQRLLVRLPQPEQDKMLVIFTEELLEVERAFTHEIAGRLTADEAKQARERLPTDNGKAFRAVMSKELDLVMGNF